MTKSKQFLYSSLTALPLAALVACGGSGSGSPGESSGDATAGPAPIAEEEQGSAPNAGQFATGDACEADPTQVVTELVGVPVALPPAAEDLPLLSDLIGSADVPVLAGVLEGDTSGLSASTALDLLGSTPLGSLPVVGEIRSICGPAVGDLSGIDPEAVVGLIPLFQDTGDPLDPTAVIGLLLVTVDSVTSGPITGVELPAGSPGLTLLEDIATEFQALIGDLLDPLFGLLALLGL